MTPKIDARNGCYGKEEETGDDGLYEFGAERATDGAPSILQGNSPASLAGQSAPSGTASSKAMTSAPIHLAAKEVPTAQPDSHTITAGSVTVASGRTSLEAPKYDGNLLPAMTAMVTGFVDKLTDERAKLFRDSTRALLPELAHMLKHEGGKNEIE